MRHTCLLIEDDPETLKSISGLLTVFGYDVVGARSYEEALVHVNAGTFCFMLCDLGILPGPGASKPEPELGRQLIGYTRNLFPRRTGEGHHRLPILVISALDSDELREGLRFGADDFLTKPLARNRTPLKTTIEEWLQKAERSSHVDCADAMRLARPRQDPPQAAAVPFAPGSTPSEGAQHAEPISEIPETVRDVPDGIDTSHVRLGVTGRVFGNRSELTIDGRAVILRNALFVGLMKLIEARLSDNEWVQREKLGGPNCIVWRGKSEIQKELKSLLGDQELIVNDGCGGYQLSEIVDLDTLAVEPLVRADHHRIAASARAILRLLGKKNHAA